MLPAIERKLNRLAMLQVLSEIEGSKDAGISIYLPAGLPEDEIKSTLAVILNEENIVADIFNRVAKSRTGAILFWGRHCKYLILPPFSVDAKVILQDYVTEPLCTLLNKDLTIALVLVRLGSYAVGVFQQEALLSSKVGTGLVHSRHKKGGSSSRRFERHRYKQAEYFFSRVCMHVQEKLDPVHRQIDYLYYGGERFTIRSFREQCSFLKTFDTRTADVLLNVREPKQASLEAAIHDVWSSKVITWQEDRDVAD